MSERRMVQSSRKRGFSLLELIIVLAVVGVLLAGLFQLTTASTRQINEQITAQQLQQYIKGYKAYLNARLDGPGTEFPHYDGTCTPVNGASVKFAAPGDTKDITPDLQCFRQNTLAKLAPNGGTYHVYVTRMADVGGRGSYMVAATVFGGQPYDDVGLGGTAGYVGAEGATFYPAGIDADDPSTTCDESAITLRSAFGAACVNGSDLTGVTPYSPATLSFISMLDVGTNDANYLWRVPAAGELNKMTVDQGMVAGVNLTWDNAPSPPGAGDGDIAMAGGSLTGVRHIIMNSANSHLGIDTRGGLIDTAGGDIATGGGDIAAGSGDIFTVDGKITASCLNNCADIHAGEINGTHVNGNDGTFQTLNSQSFLYTSDARLKNNIKTLPDALAKVMALRGVSFTWKDSGKAEIGVVAQEVQKVYPEAVASVTIDGQPRLAVQEGNLVAPLIEAVKALKAQNDDLQLQLNALRQKMEDKRN